MDESWVARYPEFERRHFWWRARRAIVRKLIDDHAGGDRLRVLDIGCGSGVTIENLVDLHDVQGLEPNEEAVAASALPERIRVGTVETADFGPGSFDAVLMLDVLEHLGEPTEALRRVRDWVSPSGLLIATVPAHGWMWTSHDDKNHHYQRYVRRGLADAVTDAGWHLVSARYLFLPLIPPKLLQVVLERSGASPDASRPKMPPKWVNWIAYWILRLDAVVALGGAGRWWAGTSVLAVARPSNMRSPQT